jgi:hypothetical protein
MSIVSFLLFSYFFTLLFTNLVYIQHNIRVFKLVKEFIFDLKKNPEKFKSVETQSYGLWLKVEQTNETICLDNSIKLNSHHLHDDFLLNLFRPLDFYYLFKIKKELKKTFPELTILK